MITRLLQRLHRIFNRDPKGEGALQLDLDGQGAVRISGLTLTLTTSAGNATYDLSIWTLTQLADAINTGTLAGNLTATVVGDGSLLARGLLEVEQQDLPDEPLLRYPTSLVYQEFQVYSWILQAQADRLTAAAKQLYLNWAEGAWLDFGGAMYGVYRQNGEADEEYRRRIVSTVLMIKCNAKALMKLVKAATGVHVDIRNLRPTGIFIMNSFTSLMNTVDDRLYGTGIDSISASYAYRFGVYISKDNINNLSATEKEAIVSLINKYKAAGTQAVYFAPNMQLLMNNVGTTMNDPDFTVGPTPGGWVQVAI